MKNQLAIIQGQQLITTSVIVAENFGKRHDRVIRKIENLIKDDDSTHLNFGVSEYQDSTGRFLKMYTMDRKSFSMLAMSFTGKKAFEWKIKFLNAFESMEKILLQQHVQKQDQAWIAQRNAGKVTRREETDTIKDFVDYAISQGSKSANRCYMAISKMQNQSLFLLEQKFKNLRDILNLRQLATIDSADAIVSKAIQDGMSARLHYKEIYQLAKARVESFADLRGKTFIPATQQIEFKAMA